MSQVRGNILSGDNIDCVTHMLPIKTWYEKRDHYYGCHIISDKQFEYLWAILQYGTLREAGQALNMPWNLIKEKLPSKFVYFIKSLDKIKIGASSGDGFPSRVSAFSTSNPHELTLIFALHGDTKDEQKIHEQYSDYHVSGEWFKATPIILDLDGKSKGYNGK